MLDNKNTRTGQGGRATENSLGFKGFNTTGSEEAAVEVLRPKLKPDVLLRNLLLLGVVLIAFCLMGYVAYQRSGLDFIPKDEGGSSFGAGRQQEVPLNP